MKSGGIVPMEITISLLQREMEKAMVNGQTKFLIDGFPRNLEQGQKFEEDVCESKFVLFLSCPEEIMEKRLLERSQTSGRVDDNVETIRKRFIFYFILYFSLKFLLLN